MSDAMKNEMINEVRTRVTAIETASIKAIEAYHAQYACVTRLGATSLQIQKAEELRARYVLAP